MGERLTAYDLEELDALRWMNDTLKGPSFQWRGNWHNGYARLVRRGLVSWGNPPAGFTKCRFAGTTITDKGRRVLEASEHG